ncbi:MAG: imidazoleglycerol-phosphate dehydratase [Longimicrobiales bacterium]
MTGLRRTTRETVVALRCSLAPQADDATGTIATTDIFFDHMLNTLARYAGFRLDVEASGDLQHHLLEDVAISLGLALRDEMPESCARFGHAVIPMDEALVEVVVDAGGRPHYEGRLPSNLYEHVFRSFAINAGFTLHVRVIRGRDRHHIVEAAFKALGMALRVALKPGDAVFSTKGAIKIEREGAVDAS